MNLNVIASSSDGNCAIVSNGATRIMVDAGLSWKAFITAVCKAGIIPESISAAVITHGHADHISGLEAIASKLRFPVYMTEGTFKEWDFKRRPLSEINLFNAGQHFEIGGIVVQSISVPHDAAAPVAYSFHDGSERISIATDLGWIPLALEEYLVQSETILLEANHDLEVLRDCGYRESLKRRITGGLGHLSNQAVFEFIRTKLTDATRWLILGHISRETNDKELVALGASLAVKQRGLATCLEII